MQLRFSGHETFVCRTFWPKKGYDFVKNNKSFSDPDSVTDLGVGKNMVSSISYWLKAMNLLEIDNRLTPIADLLLSENGYDPFMEDIGTIWILHANLIRTNYATLYSLVFNDFKRTRSTFTKTHLQDFVKFKYSESNYYGYNSSTVEKDISVFCRTYNQPDYKISRSDFEEEFSSIFMELELMTSSKEKDINGKIIEWYSIESKDRHNLPAEILLYLILDNYKGERTIAFRRLFADYNSPGIIFSISKEGLFKKIKELEKLYEGILLSETAGNIVLALPEGLSPLSVLRNYYEE